MRVAAGDDFKPQAQGESFKLHISTRFIGWFGCLVDFPSNHGF